MGVEQVDPERLREAFRSAGYTVDGVELRLGAQPALRRLVEEGFLLPEAPA